MRLLPILLFFCSVVSFAQTKNDSAKATIPEWQTPNYSQEDKIYNRTVWTFVDNPALVGFDRRLGISERYVAEKLALSVGNKNGMKRLAFQQSNTAIDLAFGGPNMNWGAGISFNSVQEGNFGHYSILWAHSYRIRMKAHNLILGWGSGMAFSRMDWEQMTFPDMIDPRYGFVYQTNEVKPHTSRVIGFLNTGLRYYWKRLSVDYAFQFGPHGLYEYAGGGGGIFFHRLKAVYHIQIDRDITLSPEVLTYNNRLNIWRFSPIVTVTFRDLAYAQMAFYDLNRIAFKLGYQLRDIVTLDIGFSAFTDTEMAAVTGLATVEGGVRFLLTTRRK